jgi:hypothetical protein
MRLVALNIREKGGIVACAEPPEMAVLGYQRLELAAGDGIAAEVVEPY